MTNRTAPNRPEEVTPELVEGLMGLLRAHGTGLVLQALRDGADLLSDHLGECDRARRRGGREHAHKASEALGFAVSDLLRAEAEGIELADALEVLADGAHEMAHDEERALAARRIEDARAALRAGASSPELERLAHMTVGDLLASARAKTDPAPASSGGGAR